MGDGAVAGYGAEKYLSECEIFEQQIMNEGKPSLVYIYNAVDAKSESFYLYSKNLSRAIVNIRVSCIDIYKSDGLAKRLGVSNGPCAVWIKDCKIQEKIELEITKEQIESICK